MSRYHWLFVLFKLYPTLVYLPFCARSLCTSHHTFQRFSAWSPDLTRFVYPDFCFWNLFSVLIWPVVFGLCFGYRLWLTDYPSALLLWLDWFLVLTHCLWPHLWSWLPLLLLFAGRMTLCTDIHIVFRYSALPWSSPLRPVFVTFWLKKIKTVIFIWLFAFGSSSASSDTTIWPDMDPAAPKPNFTRKAIRLRGQQIARQAADLRQLSQCSENMNAWLNQMAEVMSAQQATPPPIPSPAQVSAASFQHAPEPRLPPPERYAGKPGLCRSFLATFSVVFGLQPSTFPVERSRVACVITLLSVSACEWGTTVWEADEPECYNFTLFAACMKNVFDRSASGPEAAKHSPGSTLSFWIFKWIMHTGSYSGLDSGRANRGFSEGLGRSHSRPPCHVRDPDVTRGAYRLGHPRWFSSDRAQRTFGSSSASSDTDCLSYLSLLPLCPKHPLLAAILRQQQIEKIIKNKYKNHNKAILYANIFIEVHWLKFLSNNHPSSTL